MSGKRIAMLLGCMLALGCAAGTDAEGGPEASSTLAIIEHNAAEVGALEAERPLQLDLGVPQTVHVLEFTEVQDLAHVELLTEQGTFVLSELVSDLAEQSHRVVLGATQQQLDAYFAEHAANVETISGASQLGRARQARIKLRDCGDCVDPTGIGPVICSDDSPCR